VSWLFLLASWIAALAVVCLVYAWWNQRGLRLHLAVIGGRPAPGSPTAELPEPLLRESPVPDPIFEQDGVELEVGLDTNGAPRGPARVAGLVGGEPVGAATGVIPRVGWRHRVELRSLRRGPVGASSWVVESSDFAGFFRTRRASPDAEVALVLPRFASIAGRLQARELEASVAAPRTGSGTEVFGVREYRPGDSRRRIHWRSSARRGSLVVREYEPPGAPTLGIFCDPSPVSVEVADQVARLAASEAWDCVRDGGRVMLWAPGLEPSRPAEARSFWALLEWLARYPAPAVGDADLAPTVSEAVAVTAAGHPELVEALETVRHRGGAVRAWIVGDAALGFDVPVQHVGTSWPL
jgi:uncharacterized protein (DUF58 family)